MAIYSKISSLVNGVNRNVDLSTNTLAVQALQINGATSGSVTVNATAATTSYSVTLPAAQGSANTTLVNDGSGNLTWTSSLNYDGTFEIINSSDHTKGITFDASAIGSGLTRSLKMPNANVDLGNLTNSNINATAGISYSKLNLTGSIVDADIASAAAIAVTKLAAVTASKVLVSDASGFVSASTTSTTTLGYLDISSSLTSLLSAKAPLASPTFTGTVSGVTASMVGLGNVTNDAQLKASDLTTDGTLAANSDTLIPSEKAVKTYADTKVPQTTTVNGHALSSNVTVTQSDVGLSNVTNDAQLKASDLDIDGTLAANSDTKIPSQKAVKTYVDTTVGAAANQSLSNLTGPTAINQDFIFNTGADVTIKTVDATTSNIGGAHTKSINISTGNALSNFLGSSPTSSGDINLTTGTAHHTASGSIIHGNINLNSSGTLNLNVGAISTTASMTMSSSGSITDMIDPTNAQDAATKNYVDTQDALKLSLTGGTMSGAIAMGASKITGLAAGSANGDAVRFEQAVLTDGSHAITGDQSFSSTAKITNLVDPISAQDAATKKYVDDKISGQTFKVQVESASQPAENVTISAPGTTIGGYVGIDEVGDRILLMYQTAPAENGIWLWNGAAVPMTRATDADTWAKLAGAIVYVAGGTSNGAKFICVSAETGTLDTDPVVFTTFSATSSLDGSGTAGYNAYWTATHTLAAEQYVAASRGGFAADVSAFSGVVKASAGVFSASAIVNADIASGAAIAYSKLSLTSSIVNADIASGAAIAESKLALDYSTASLNTAIGTKVTANGAITGATKTKITYDSKGLVTAGADATTADIADSTDKRYVTDAELAVLANTSGTNTGDVTIGTANGLSLAAQALSLAAASTSVTGALTSTDWNTFNNKLTSTLTSAHIFVGNGSNVATDVAVSGDVSLANTGAMTVNQAPKIVTSELANEALSATTLVALRYAKSADIGFVAGRMSKADIDATTVDNFYVAGLAYPAGSVSAGGAVNITQAGLINVPSHGFTVGAPLFLDASGAITATAPTTTGYAVVRVGLVKDANNINVQIQVMYIA